MYHYPISDHETLYQLTMYCSTFNALVSSFSSRGDRNLRVSQYSMLIYQLHSMPHVIMHVHHFSNRVCEGHVLECQDIYVFPSLRQCDTGIWQ